MPGLDDVRDLIDSRESTPNSVAQIDMPTRTPQSAPTSTPTVAPTNEAGPSSSDPKDPTVVPLETAVALGVGSDQPSETPTDTPEPTPEPEPTATATEEPVEIAQATDEPAENEQDPVIPPPDPTDAPAETSEPDPTATEEETTEPDPTVAETEEVAEPEGEAGGALQDQGATLESNEVPAQTFELNGLRVQISGAYRAESLPDLTLGRSAAGEWVVLLLDAVNWSDDAADLAMPEFRLAPASDLTAEIPLDPSTGAVATYLNLPSALRASDAAVVPQGGYQPIALVFSIPAALENPVLLAGEQAVALDRSFEHQTSGQLEGPGFSAPDMVTGTVVDVIDGQTVSVDIEGETTTVRYYGLQPADAGACYTEESATANASLVEGQTLLFERERRNRSETTTYLRDAWLVDESGDRHLVAASLVAEGAAVPEPSDPDIRFAGWLAGKALLAESAGAGLWSACG
jgi:endonuclease YncB( thermonuclease family)